MAHQLSFLKVLAAVAWADGQIREEERNRIKTLLNAFELDLAERKEVDALLSRPVGFEEALDLTKEFAASLAGPGVRRRLLEEVERMLGDEVHRTDPERELLGHVRAIVQSHGPIDGLVEKLRGLFGGFLGRAAPDPAAPHEDRDAAFLREVMDDRPERDSDLQRTCAEFSREATMGDRLRIVETMFERMAADGAIDKREVEHVRRVADLLWIPWPEYLAVRDRFRDRIES
jgi:uncharacterized tellurite resistance protein B-like protein